MTPAFDAADRVLSSGEATYAYSPEGQLSSKTTSAGVTTYRYTGLSELESASLPDGRVVSYRYDANGSRVAKLIDGQVTERYEWADPTRLLATYDASGALTRRFLYADARVPYGMETSAGTYWLAFDQVGSLRAVTDQTGALVKAIEYDSFGNVIADSNPELDVPLGFAGGLADSDTGLVHFGAREYDSATGRWISRDPIGLSGGDVNLYGYCLGDPVGLVDPAGLCGISCAAIGGAIILFALGAVVWSLLPYSTPKTSDYDAASPNDSPEDWIEDYGTNRSRLTSAVPVAEAGVEVMSVAMSAADAAPVGVAMNARSGAKVVGETAKVVEKTRLPKDSVIDILLNAVQCVTNAVTGKGAAGEE